jgi:RimJ/RimL family protein N-acetyltransferase
MRVMEKAGMRYEGQIHLPNTQGESEDRVRYALEGDELRRLNDMTIRIEPPL